MSRPINIQNAYNESIVTRFTEVRDQWSLLKYMPNVKIESSQLHGEVLIFLSISLALRAYNFWTTNITREANECMVVRVSRLMTCAVFHFTNLN